MSLFWTATENMPDGMGFELYGKEHLIWLASIAVFIIALCVISRRLSPKGVNTLCIIVCSACLFLELFGDLVLLVTGQLSVNYLPLDLCGIALYAEFVCCLKPTPILKELCYCLFMPGALAALAFSNWVDLPPTNFFAIRSFVIHALIIAYPLMLICSGQLKPDVRKLPKCFAIGIAMCIPIYFINKALDQNFFFLNWPSPGSPLVWFADWFGNPGYLVGLPIMIFIVWFFLYFRQIMGLIFRRGVKK